MRNAAAHTKPKSPAPPAAPAPPSLPTADRRPPTPRPPFPQPTGKKPVPLDAQTMSLIKKLDDLRKAGLLSDTEFETKRNDLLAKAAAAGGR